MPIIKILPENLINQIAAGEVVERHSSVVKELVENSIDAGADKITIEINDKNEDVIIITDNGTGMTFDDAKLALERHATSKISTLNDLENINTMGFRGEAVASIASVSHIIIKTKTAKDKTATLVECEYGKITKHERATYKQGTQIEVRNLFFNTPARKKYLKTPSTEYHNILNDFQTIALTRPDIHFKLVHNQKIAVEYTKTKKLINRIQSIFGNHTSENCIFFKHENDIVKIQGYIGKPSIARSGTKHQYLFVNSRPIKHNLFSYAITRGYDSMLMGNKKPFYVLNMKIAPEHVDVNVHPRKLEARFTSQNAIFATLQKSTKEILQNNSLMPSFDYERTQKKPLEVKDSSQQIVFENQENFKPQNHGKINKYSYKKENKTEVSMIPIAQIAKSYIIAEHEEGLVLIDQHAVHERILFEELKNKYENDSPVKQQLLMPQNIELSALEAEIFHSYENIFSKLGFEIESFGGNTYIIHSVPETIKKDNPASIIKNVLNDLAEGKDAQSAKEPQIKAIEYMACRSAVKFGKDLSRDEMYALIEQLDKLNTPYTCPHGRPSMIKLTFNELEKRFKRI